MNGTEISPDGPWSLGVLVGGPIAVVLILIGLAVVAFGIAEQRTSRDGVGLMVGGSLWAGLIVLICALPMVGYYPYSAEYHQWRDVTGTVQQIDKRLISSGDSMEDKFVIRFGDGQQFSCDDTRCAQVAEGDDVTLSCKRAWQYTGTDGYNCRFVSSEAGR